MARFESKVVAMQEIIKAEEQITQILSEDLRDLNEDQRTIDLWLEKFGKVKTQRERKEMLINQEMMKTDAEIYLEFQKSLN